MRESNFNWQTNLAQGDPLSDYSIHRPRGEPKVGHPPPFTWEEAAVRALQIDALDKVPDWTLPRAAFEFETMNGFGYRNFHGINSPYVWAGSNNYVIGKYESDGKFNAQMIDRQLGCIPVLCKAIEFDPDVFAIQDAPAPPPMELEVGPTKPGPLTGAAWIQDSLNRLMQIDPPLVVDGIWGRETRAAVRDFQEQRHLVVDGYPGPATCAAMDAELEAMELLGNLAKEPAP